MFADVIRLNRESLADLTEGLPSPPLTLTPWMNLEYQGLKHRRGDLKGGHTQPIWSLSGGLLNLVTRLG